MKVCVCVPDQAAPNPTARGLMAGVLVMLLLLVSSSADATVRAWLDRNSINMGETVTLNVESGDAGEPDFSVLENDFRIAGQSTSSQVQIINGAMARSNLSAVALEPLREGVIEIPPIPVGNDHTEPLRLTVRPMARGSAAAGDDVFLEVEVDTNTPYVQQQVAYTVRLYYAVSLLEGNLDEPAGAGLQVRRIGDDVNYSRQIGARRYNVVERRYAIAADRSGSVTVAPVSFRGRIAGGGRYNSFFGSGTPLTTGSDAIVLDVRPAPPGAPMPWVPAQSLRLTDDAARLPEVLTARAGLQNWADAVAGDMERHYSPGRTWEALARAALQLLEPGDVLDVGAGTGVLAELLAPRARRYVCVDVDARAIAVARERLESSPNTEVLHGDMHTLAFPDASFDLVLLMHTLTYADNPANALAESARVLRPGGQLLATTLNQHQHREAIDTYGHANLGFKPASLVKLTRKAGLEVVSCEVITREKRPPHYEVVSLLARHP